MIHSKKIVTYALTFALTATSLLAGTSMGSGAVEAKAKTKQPKLSKTSVTLQNGQSKTITVKKNGTKKIVKTSWSVTSGKSLISLSKKKRTSVKMKASTNKTGSAKIKAVIRYKRKGKNKTYKVTKTLKVKVTMTTGSLREQNVANAVTQYTSMAKLMEKYGMKFGTVINYNYLADENYKNLVKYHFNSVTAGNEFKAYSLLNQGMSKATADGMPAMDYSKADAIMDYAKENGIKVRGHNLVWYAYMTDWFFHEGYDASKPYASRDVMIARMKSYIEQVVTHFETKYPGVIYCWDVVNEAVGDSAAEAVAGDARRLRTKNNLFYDHIGDDYVALAFKYAKNTVDKLGVDIKLFYNDYNCFLPAKRDCVINLVKGINTYEKDAAGNYRKLVDGIGMQGYIGGYGTQSGCMNEENITAIKTAINLFAAEGVEVQLTEMAVRNYKGDAATVAKHAEFYGKLFTMFKEVNAGTTKPLTGVSIWSMFDNPTAPQGSYNYSMNGLYGGLFDQNYGVKQAFINVYNILNQ